MLAVFARLAAAPDVFRAEAAEAHRRWAEAETAAAARQREVALRRDQEAKAQREQEAARKRQEQVEAQRRAEIQLQASQWTVRGMFARKHRLELWRTQLDVNADGVSACKPLAGAVLDHAAVGAACAQLRMLVRQLQQLAATPSSLAALLAADGERVHALALEVDCAQHAVAVAAEAAEPPELDSEKASCAAPARAELARATQARDAAASAARRAVDALLLALQPALAAQAQRAAELAAAQHSAQQLASVWGSPELLRCDAQASGDVFAKSLALPALASGPGSAACTVEAAWGAYSRARQTELAAEAGLEALEARSAADEKRCAPTNRAQALCVLDEAVAGRERAVLQLYSAMAECEAEYAGLEAGLRAAARAAADWCLAAVLPQDTQSRRLLQHGEALRLRAAALRERLALLAQAQERRPGLVERLDSLLDERDALDVREGTAQVQLSAAQRRGRPGPVLAATRELERARAARAALVTSGEYRGVTGALRGLLRHLPELSAQCPSLHPLRGGLAQGLPVRDLETFEDVQPLVHPGRHELFTARCPAEEPEAGLEQANREEKADEKAVSARCVLKAFDADDVRALRRELAALHGLQHPNVVRVLGLCRRGPATWLLQLPLFPRNLRAWLREARAESAEQRLVRVVPVLRGMLEGLRFLHEKGVVHCDLKPENVLLTERDSPVLADFETSRTRRAAELGTETVTRVVGHGVYVAPEVLVAGPSAASDMFAFGVISAEALLAPLSLAEPGLDVRRLVARAQGDTRAALEALLGADPANRPTAAAALRHPAFRLHAPRRECCICFEEALRADGVECDGDPRHFVCRECFAELINAQSQKDLMVLQRCGGRVSCPARPCAAGPFSDAQVAAMTSSEVFSTYIENCTKLAETRLVQELTEQKNQELRRELSRLSSLDERQRRVEAAVMRVQEVLTDKCPRCEAAFLDYANCSALTCHRCGCGFCAWCLRDCGADAHQHVANCPLNVTPGRQVYAEARVWEGSRLQRQRQAVRHILPLVLQRVAQTLRILGLDDLL